ncbi:MAG: T9SS type A sorting domain-containing protein [Arachidicoccus sp.]|nr:T9SS type A sorting domain-containing protein [Arachidicoccus sp.]
MKRIFTFFVFVLSLINGFSFSQNYYPITFSSGINKNVICQGSAASTTLFDNNICSFFYNGYKGLSNGLPTSGKLTSSSFPSTDGYYQLITTLNANNALWINGTATSTLVFNTANQVSYNSIFVLAAYANANGNNASFSYQINYTDGTSEAAVTKTISDWTIANSTKIKETIHRVWVSSNSDGGQVYMFDYAIVPNSAAKKIKSVTFKNISDATGYFPGQFGVFAITGYISSNTTLPVKYGEKLSCTYTNKQIKLEWTTTSEINNNYFDIQKFVNNQWVPIGKVKSDITSGNGSNYSFTDQNPVNGNNLYRLVQFDLDGNSEISPTAAINVIGLTETVSVYPNPASNYLSLSNVSAGSIIKIINLNGRSVLNTLYNSAAINICSLPSGIYFIQISDNNRKINTFKFIKQ